MLDMKEMLFKQYIFGYFTKGFMVKNGIESKPMSENGHQKLQTGHLMS